MSKFSKVEGEWDIMCFDFAVTMCSESPGILSVLEILETISEEKNTPKVKDMDPEPGRSDQH